MVDRPIEIALLLLLAFQLLLGWAAFRRIGQFRSPRARALAWCCLAILALLVLGGFSFNLGRVRRVFPLYYLGEHWRAAVTLWMAASVPAVVLAAGVGRLFRRHHRARQSPCPTRRHILRTAQTLAAAAPFAVIGYGTFIERRNVRTVEADLYSPGLAPDLDGLRILQISDVHLSPTMSERDLARIVDQANETRPDLGVITGDLITKRRDPLEACVRQLARLRATNGVYGCMGNHEIWAEAEDELESMAAAHGIHFLRYEAQLLRFGAASLNLVGVDYEPTANRSRYLRRAAPLRRPDAFNLLLSHNPDVISAAAEKGFDVTLAGHTHGGQITLEFLHPATNIARYYTPFVYGRYDVRGPGRTGAAWVTRGVGTIFVPARLGAPPEIALIRLRRSNQSS